jgi:hypothetical protein
MKGRAGSVPTSAHGTYAGYKAHVYRFEIPCQACKEARNDFDRGRYAARKDRLRPDAS